MLKEYLYSIKMNLSHIWGYFAYISSFYLKLSIIPHIKIYIKKIINFLVFNKSHLRRTTTYNILIFIFFILTNE